MDSLHELLAKKSITKNHTNKIYLLAADIATITNSTPNRFLRFVKKDFSRAEGLLANFKEILEIKRQHNQKINNKLSYFLWLTKNT